LDHQIRHWKDLYDHELCLKFRQQSRSSFFLCSCCNWKMICRYSNSYLLHLSFLTRKSFQQRCLARTKFPFCLCNKVPWKQLKVLQSITKTKIVWNTYVIDPRVCTMFSDLERNSPVPMKMLLNKFWSFWQDTFFAGVSTSGLPTVSSKGSSVILTWRKVPNMQS